MNDRKNRDAIELKQLNPNAIQFLRLATDRTKRVLIFQGGSSSGKSYSIAQGLLLLTFFERGNSLVMRKVGASISISIFEDFKQAIEQLRVGKFVTIRYSAKRIVNTMTGAWIDFRGLDDPEKIKGISNYRWVFMDEWNEFDEADYKQMRKRLRGQSGQQIVTAFNPISEEHWIKRNVIDCETWHDLPMDVRLAGCHIPPELCKVKSLKTNSPKPVMNPRTGEVETHDADMVLIQSTYLNNFWVVGSPDGTYGYYDEQCIADFERDRVSDPDYYKVYALGEWGVVRTGNEFFPAFKPGRNTASVSFDPSLPLHLSVDDNRLPYISYTFWQADFSDGVRIRQFHEICAAAPDNSATKSALLVADYLKGIGYTDRIYLHGDCNIKRKSTVDDETRSFFDKVISTLEGAGFEITDRVSASNPSVSLSGEFINSVWEGSHEGVSIEIGKQCLRSIADYSAVQKDANGAMTKPKVKDKATGLTYEKQGHLSDTLRYVCTDLLRAQYAAFSNKRKRNIYARDGMIRYFNPDTAHAYTDSVLYLLAYGADRFAIILASRAGNLWNVTQAAVLATTSTDEVGTLVKAAKCRVFAEVGKSYYPFVRELREADTDVKVCIPETDTDRRIAATSDFVKTYIRFSETLAAEDERYEQFLTSVLDYNPMATDKAASAALSGLAKVAAKITSEE